MTDRLSQTCWRCLRHAPKSRLRQTWDGHWECMNAEHCEANWKTKETPVTETICVLCRSDTCPGRANPYDCTATHNGMTARDYLADRFSSPNKAEAKTSPQWVYEEKQRVTTALLALWLDGPQRYYHDTTFHHGIDYAVEFILAGLKGDTTLIQQMLDASRVRTTIDPNERFSQPDPEVVEKFKRGLGDEH